MHLKYILVTIIVGFFGQVFAQNGNFSSLPMFNQMYYNPGYAGDGNDIEARVFVREQWMKFPGAPRTQTFNVDAPFKLFGQRHGAGLSIINDGYGNFSNTELNISYAYRKSLIQGEMGIGLGLNLVSHSFKAEWLDPSGGNGGTDNIIPTNSAQEPLLIDANLGMFYRADNLYLSLSCRNLLDSKVNYVSAEGGTENSSNQKQTLIGKQLYFSTGYEYQLPNPMFSVQPGVFVATDFASSQIDISGIVTYNKRFFGGMGYKPTDAVIFLAGIDLPSGIHAAVSYDVTTSRIIKFSTGSFEFMAGYKFSLDIDKDNRKYKSVRFL